MDSLDFIVMAIGAILVGAAILVSYLSGMKQGKAKVIMEYKDCVSLQGLSQPARDKMQGYVKIVQVWDDHRRPDKHLYKPVHYD